MISGKTLSKQNLATQATSNTLAATSLTSTSGAPTQVSSSSLTTSAQQSSPVATASSNTADPDTSGTGAPSTALVSATSSTPAGAIAGGVIGGLVVLALIAVLFWWRQRKRRAAEPFNIDASPFQDEPTSGTTAAPEKYALEKTRQGGWGHVSPSTGSTSVLPTTTSPSVSGSAQTTYPVSAPSDVEGPDGSEARLLALREQVDREIAAHRAMRDGSVSEAPPSYFGH